MAAERAKAAMAEAPGLCRLATVDNTNKMAG